MQQHVRSCHHNYASCGNESNVSDPTSKSWLELCESEIKGSSYSHYIFQARSVQLCNTVVSLKPELLYWNNLAVVLLNNTTTELCKKYKTALHVHGQKFILLMSLTELNLNTVLFIIFAKKKNEIIITTRSSLAVGATLSEINKHALRTTKLRRFWKKCSITLSKKLEAVIKTNSWKTLKIITTGTCK